jgi:hypothetical protein
LDIYLVNTDYFQEFTWQNIKIIKKMLFFANYLAN